MDPGVVLSVGQAVGPDGRVVRVPLEDQDAVGHTTSLPAVSPANIRDMGDMTPSGGEEPTMYAVFSEVNADESHIDVARKYLNETAAPRMKEAGAKSAVWLAPQGGRGVSVTVFDSEEEARNAAAHLKVGGSSGVPGVTFTTVEVREVLASL